MLISHTDKRKRDLARDAAVAKIIVTTSSGRKFHGDEASQDRMSRAASIGNDADTLQWKCAEIGWQTVTVAELKEAIRLAGTEQTRIWGAPVDAVA